MSFTLPTIRSSTFLLFLLFRKQTINLPILPVPVPARVPSSSKSNNNTYRVNLGTSSLGQSQKLLRGNFNLSIGKDESSVRDSSFRRHLWCVICVCLTLGGIQQKQEKREKKGREGEKFTIVRVYTQPDWLFPVTKNFFRTLCCQTDCSHT